MGTPAKAVELTFRYLDGRTETHRVEEPRPPIYYLALPPDENGRRDCTPFRLVAMKAPWRQRLRYEYRQIGL